MEEFLARLSKEMNTQDNLATAHPLYCVFEKERIWGMDSEYTDKWAWFHCDDNEEPDYEITDVEAGKDDAYEKVYFVERNRFVNAHFTRRAADRFILENRHNLSRPFVFGSSLYRCPEMIELQEWLKGLTGAR